MNEEVRKALALAVQLRRAVLQTLTHEQRIHLVERLLEDFFVDQRAGLLKWASLTGQSAQVDSGYIAQHLASIVLGEPGQGFRGKGLDLANGSEVKSAAILSGVDRPRWNHDMGTVADDAKRLETGRPLKSATYTAAPLIFYMLFDRVVEGIENGELVLRVRAWAIDPQQDEAWVDLVQRWLASRSGGRYNMQLHPPVGYDDSIVVNMEGNLDMVNVKVMEARLRGFVEAEPFSIEWKQEPPEQVVPIAGRCATLTYIARQRPSRLGSATDFAPDLDAIARLIPGVDIGALVAAADAERAAAAAAARLETEDAERHDEDEDEDEDADEGPTS